MQFHIGTSGWSYADWKGQFYPAGLKSTEWLTHYAKIFSTTEINSSFYRLPNAKTVLNWADKVPPDFKFCVKMSRYLTHIKRLKEPEETLERFFNLFAPIQAQMGPVLIQLPKSVPFDHDTVAYLFDVLSSAYKAYSFAIEARHPSWLDEAAYSLMKDHDIAWVISQSGVGFPYAEVVTGKHIYIRFHGPEQLFNSSYSNEMLQAFADKCTDWIKNGHILWIYFNNTMRGLAIDNALYLRDLLEKRSGI